MITKPVPERREMRRRAIADYLRQDHPDRELVVVIDLGDSIERATIVAEIKSLGRQDIRTVLPGGTPTLGALRNLSVAQARGELLCQWDDDDLHHPGRIGRQMAAMHASGGNALLLADVMMLQAKAGRLLWTNWAQTAAGGHPATLLCHRRVMVRYPESGPAAQKGEDLSVALALAEANHIHRLAGAPHLYVYVVHGANTCDEAHHTLLSESLAISKGLLSRREAMLREGLAPLDFGGPISVDGANGPAFILRP